MKFIHLINDLSLLNIGIWRPPLSLKDELLLYGISTLIVTRDKRPLNEELIAHKSLIKIMNTDKEWLVFLKSRQINKAMIFTHGCWSPITKWGKMAKDIGLKWYVLPQGMLEPWSLNQKKLKKMIYLKLFESRMLRSADGLIAVSKPEAMNLSRLFPNQFIKTIPNAVEKIYLEDKPIGPPFTFLFMGRLHVKKGVINLIRAWKKSSLCNNPNFKLVLIGPDDGQLSALKKEMANDELNIAYMGAVYGEQKELFLKQSHFFILPSHSEGFPSSIIEAMSYGNYPLITDGCNFLEAIENELALKITPNVDDILEGLNKIKSDIEEKKLNFKNLAVEIKNFIQQNYSVKVNAEKYVELFRKKDNVTRT